ncbi:hypothetical protein PC129_g9829 [Phytophthora cactorum]|uniref:Uncharacterized protein n=1 Tax=Phytophthora cactorum TaxID=29920 RepID=A0A8T1I4V3_9STRA|nr:hypothetical protein Pcac1_g7490 [Phytophthora cactorum]KAG2820991.1 hypothetical protein PC112_g11549 [Phytophthora cactorum]KAG2902451.1 hypothetical protein PC114_g12734 [Phytophthora cactorum]KAG2944158.1 hypothetical protein PC117_g9164 [Phytophthora cactorum]KAG3015066.1 hypothetical protein PC119_g11907 [Phytophthora cactorum]
MARGMPLLGVWCKNGPEAEQAKARTVGSKAARWRLEDGECDMEGWRGESLEREGRC